MARSYKEIENSFSDIAVSYPSKNDYRFYIGYAEGKVIGTAPTKNELPGAKVFEETFAEDGYKAHQAAYQTYHEQVHDTWYKEIRQDHSEISDHVFALCYNEAYDRGHSAGMDEIENLLFGIVDFAKNIIRASKIT